MEITEHTPTGVRTRTLTNAEIDADADKGFTNAQRHRLKRKLTNAGILLDPNAEKVRQALLESLGDA